jgi:hypothetical protein
MTKSKTYANINSLDDLTKLMADLGTDCQVRTASVVFGRAYIRTYAYPSKINHNDIGDSPMSARGFWKAGKLYQFPAKLQVKYQNSHLREN